MDIKRIAPPEPYGAIIFDCDGTLVDTMPAHVKAWVASYRSLGIDISEEPFFRMAGLPNRAIIEALNDEFGYGLDVAATQDEKEQRYLETLHTVVEIKAVADIARAHQGKAPIAVASSGLGRVVRETLTATGLISLFDAITTADRILER